MQVREITATKSKSRTAVLALSALCFLLFIGLLAALAYIGARNAHLSQSASLSCASKSKKEGSMKLPPRLTKRELLLPTHVEPIQYWIDIQPMLKLFGSKEEDMRFYGNVTINIKCINRTSHIVLHYKHLSQITNSSVTLEPLSDPSERMNLNDLKVILNSTMNKITVCLGKHGHLEPGHVYTLRFTNYSGIINTDGIGFYLSTYKIDNVTRYLAATQFEVAGARQAFPCFDEPRYKANFTISITRRKEFTSRSNMRDIDHELLDDGFVRDSYATSVQMSTYLVAWVICNFQYKESKSGDIVVRAYARPNAISEVNLALDSAVRILSYFEKYFDIPFVMDKIDLIALPDFSHGAMENWGLVTYRESAMLYDPERDTRARREDVAMITGHEIAHQWFGNLVTMEWWDDLWLNEGLACYMGYLSPNVTDPEEEMTDKFLFTNVMHPMRGDTLNTTHPIVTEVYHPAEILQMFDTIVYKKCSSGAFNGSGIGKGASVLHMLRSLLTHDVFRDGLRIYLKEHMYGNAISDNLWTAYDQAVDQHNMHYRMNHRKVSSIMKPWIYETGYPYVNVTRDGDGFVSVTQGRYLFNVTAREQNNQTWVIPFTYVYKSKPDFWNPRRIWVDSKKAAKGRVSISRDDWVIGNVDHSAFYRVNYDSKNWNMLANHLELAHTDLPPIHRAQILHDSFEFAKGDLISINTAMEMTVYLKKETEYLPWMTALDNFLFLDAIFQIEPTYNLYQAYVQGLITPIYESIDWEKRSHDDKYQTYLNTEIIQYACFVGIKHCVEQSKRLFSQWQNAPLTNPIPNDLLHPVICTALREGGQEEWEFIWKQYLSAGHESRKSIYLQTLGCTPIPWLLVRFYDKLFNRDIVRAFDVPSMLVSVQNNPSARRLLWTFIKTHWERFEKELKDLTQTLSVVFEYFGTQQDITDFEQFLTANEVKYARRRFLQSLETTKFIVNWKKTHLESVIAWLRQKLNNYDL